MIKINLNKCIGKNYTNVYKDNENADIISCHIKDDICFILAGYNINNTDGSGIVTFNYYPYRINISNGIIKCIDNAILVKYAPDKMEVYETINKLRDDGFIQKIICHSQKQIDFYKNNGGNL